MYSKLKRLTALMLSVAMFFGMVPTGAFADEVASAWVLPTAGKELVKAETYETGHSDTMILYEGESTVKELTVPIGGNTYNPKHMLNTHPDVAEVTGEVGGSQLSVEAKNAGFTTYSYMDENNDDANYIYSFLLVRVIDPALTIKAPAVAAPGDVIKLTADIVRKDTDDKPIRWEVDQPGIASVDASTGELTCHQTGSVYVSAMATITVMVSSRRSAPASVSRSRKV